MKNANVIQCNYHCVNNVVYKCKHLIYQVYMANNKLLITLGIQKIKKTNYVDVGLFPVKIALINKYS